MNNQYNGNYILLDALIVSIIDSLTTEECFGIADLKGA